MGFRLKKQPQRFLIQKGFYTGEVQAAQKAQRRGARQLTSGDVLEKYVVVRQLSGTKHMGFFSGLTKGQ